MSKKEMLQQLVRMQELIVNTAKDGKRDLTHQEQKEFDNLQRNIDTLRREIASEEGEPGSDPSDNQRAALEERKRISSIYKICETAAERGIDINANDFVERGVSVEDVNKEVLKRFMENGAPSTSGIKVTTDEADKFRSAASDALMMRGGITLVKPADGARDLRGMRIRDLAIECAQRAGISNAQRLNDDDLLRRALDRKSVV